jgi:hypothetical protein
MLFAHAPGRIGFEVGAEDGGATRLAGAVGTFGQALQGAVHIIEDALGVGQLGLISLFHGGRVPRPPSRLPNLGR